MENNTNIIELRGITKVYEDGYTAVDNFQEGRICYAPWTFRLRQDDDTAHDRGIFDAFIGGDTAERGIDPGSSAL